MNTITAETSQVVYWHKDLPPSDAESIGQHTVEATSSRVHGAIAHRDEHWTRCERDLMEQTHQRMGQEIARLGGRYAHVYKEAIDTRHDDATGEAWLRGRFEYTLYR
jgi:hypothetical protein